MPSDLLATKEYFKFIFRVLDHPSMIFHKQEECDLQSQRGSNLHILLHNKAKGANEVGTGGSKTETILLPSDEAFRVFVVEFQFYFSYFCDGREQQIFLQFSHSRPLRNFNKDPVIMIGNWITVSIVTFYNSFCLFVNAYYAPLPRFATIRGLKCIMFVPNVSNKQTPQFLTLFNPFRCHSQPNLTLSLWMWPQLDLRQKKRDA